jgi:hypothetical protein
VLALLSLTVVPIFLFLIEGSLALAGRAGITNETSTGIDLLHRYSEFYGWEPRPGAGYVSEGKRVTINERGYRGRLVPRERQPATTRVVLVGDSVAFGLEVDDDETYASLLDARDNGIDVVNLAVQGYGPGQSLLRLEREGLDYQPDVVVFGFCLSNDFADAMLRTFLYDGSHPKPYFTVEGDQLVKHDEQLRLGTVGRLALWLQDRSRLYRLLAAPARPEPLGAHAERPWLRRRQDALRDPAAAQDTTFRIIERMRDAATSRGAAFLLVLHPDEDAARGRSPWADALEQSALLEGLTIVDLRERYAARGLAFNEVALDGIGHLSARGHKRTARILEEVLAEDRLQGYGGAATLTGTSFHPPR